MHKSEKWKWSRVQLVATPWTAAHQAPPSMGFSRWVLEWGAIAFSKSWHSALIGAEVVIWLPGMIAVEVLGQSLSLYVQVLQQNCHRLGNLNVYFSQIWRLKSTRSRSWQPRVCWGPTSSQAVIFLCPHMAEGGERVHWIPFYQGRSPGGGHDNPLQYSCLEYPMDRGAWRAIVHRIAQSWQDWNNFARTHNPLYGLLRWH